MYRELTERTISVIVIDKTKKSRVFLYVCTPAEFLNGLEEDTSVGHVAVYREESAGNVLRRLCGAASHSNLSRCSTDL